jgi:hypothetical protein
MPYLCLFQRKKSAAFLIFLVDPSIAVDSYKSAGFSFASDPFGEIIACLTRQCTVTLMIVALFRSQATMPLSMWREMLLI